MLGLLHDGLVVVEIVTALTQQKDCFVASRRSIFDRLWYCVRLVPDYLLAQVPAVGAQREGQHPRNSNQVFRLAPNNIHSTALIWRPGSHPRQKILRLCTLNERSPCSV